MDLFNDIDTSLAGFRLQYLEVFNWGTFNKVRWKIGPKKVHRKTNIAVCNIGKNKFESKSQQESTFHPLTYAVCNIGKNKFERKSNELRGNLQGGR